MPAILITAHELSCTSFYLYIVPTIVVTILFTFSLCFLQDEADKVRVPFLSVILMFVASIKVALHLMLQDSCKCSPELEMNPSWKLNSSDHDLPRTGLVSCRRGTRPWRCRTSLRSGSPGGGLPSS